MEKSKFFQLNLIDILRISQNPKLVIHNCVNIILNQIGSKELLKGPMTICFKNKTNMSDWIKTIHNFKECQLDSNNHLKDNKVLVDFRKVNTLMPNTAKGKLNGFKGSLNNIQEKAENKLFYDNADKVLRRNNAGVKKQEKVKYLMEKIVSSITGGSIQTNLIKKKMLNQLKKTRNNSKMMQKQQRLIEKIVEKRIQMENLKKERLLNLEAKNKEIRLLKAVKSKILQMKQKEVKVLDKELKRQINFEKKLSNNKTKKMINYLVNKSQTINPGLAARKAAERLNQGLSLKKIKGVKIAVPVIGKSYSNSKNSKNAKNAKSPKNAKMAKKIIKTIQLKNSQNFKKATNFNYPKSLLKFGIKILPNGKGKGEIKLKSGKTVIARILKNGKLQLPNGKILAKSKIAILKNIYKPRSKKSGSIKNNSKKSLAKLSKSSKNKLLPNGKVLLVSNLTKQQVKKLKPEVKKIIVQRVKQAAEQKAKSEKIFIPGLYKNEYAKGSVSSVAEKVMENKQMKNYNRCIDSRVLNFTNTNYIHATCKDIYGENVIILFIFI